MTRSADRTRGVSPDIRRLGPHPTTAVKGGRSGEGGQRRGKHAHRAPVPREETKWPLGLGVGVFAYVVCRSSNAGSPAVNVCASLASAQVALASIYNKLHMQQVAYGRAKIEGLVWEYS